MIGVGDLVVCVDGAPCRCGCGEQLGVSEGAVYRVEGVIQYVSNSYHCLILEGVPETGRHKRGINVARFRKVQHDKREACEAEFRILLQLSKKRVKA